MPLSDEALLEAVRDYHEHTDPVPNGLADLGRSLLDCRALTVKQPWGAAIVHGPKDVENRTTKTNRRGLVLIHAGVGVDRTAPDRSPALTRWLRPLTDASNLTVRGAIVGTAEIVDCHQAEPWWRGSCCSAWGETPANTEALWHWVLGARRAFAEPVPARGMLGFWRPDAVALAAVLRQIQAAAA